MLIRLKFTTVYSSISRKFAASIRHTLLPPQARYVKVGAITTSGNGRRSIYALRIYTTNIRTSKYNYEIASSGKIERWYK